MLTFSSPLNIRNAMQRMVNTRRMLSPLIGFGVVIIAVIVMASYSMLGFWSSDCQKKIDEANAIFAKWGVSVEGEKVIVQRSEEYSKQDEMQKQEFNDDTNRANQLLLDVKNHNC